MNLRTLVLFIISIVCCVIGLVINKPEPLIIAVVLFLVEWFLNKGN